MNHWPIRLGLSVMHKHDDANNNDTNVVANETHSFFISSAFYIIVVDNIDFFIVNSYPAIRSMCQIKEKIVLIN